MGIPRTVALEYPYGRPIGQAGDAAGQRQVLLATLSVLQQAREPGQVVHLPFQWPEDPKQTHWHPPEMSPIVKAHLADIKRAREQQKGRR